MSNVRELPTNAAVAEYQDTVTAFQATQLGHLALTDPAAFWAALTPEQAAALLRAAPKVAAPWQRQRAGHWNRLAVSSHDHRCIGRAVGSGSWGAWWLGEFNEEGGANTAANLTEAMALVDAALRSLGWLLLDKEPTP